MGEAVFLEISLIIISCAALSWMALVLHQPLIGALFPSPQVTNPKLKQD